MGDNSAKNGCYPFFPFVNHSCTRHPSKRIAVRILEIMAGRRSTRYSEAFGLAVSAVVRHEKASYTRPGTSVALSRKACEKVVKRFQPRNKLAIVKSMIKSYTEQTDKYIATKKDRSENVTAKKASVIAWSEHYVAREDSTTDRKRRMHRGTVTTKLLCNINTIRKIFFLRLSCSSCGLEQATSSSF